MTDNTQPDHIVDINEIVTDTNQASEDELHELLIKKLNDKLEAGLRAVKDGSLEPDPVKLAKAEEAWDGE